MDVKCRYSGLIPNCVVIVRQCARSDARWWPQGGGGRPLDKAYTEENLPLLEKGAGNLVKHIENMLQFGVRWLWPSTRSSTTPEAELKLVQKIATEAEPRARSVHALDARRQGRDRAGRGRD